MTESAKKTRPVCPVCGKPVVAAFRPFCSRRCADVGLHRSLSGAYRVPTEEPAEGGEDSGKNPPRPDD